MLIFRERTRNNNGKINPQTIREDARNEKIDASYYFTQYLAAMTPKGEEPEEWLDGCFGLVNIRAKELREFYGLKRKEVADALRIADTNYGRIEKEGWNFDRKTLYKICLFYETNPDFLFGFSEVPDITENRTIEEIKNRNIINATAQQLWEQKNPDKV